MGRSPYKKMLRREKEEEREKKEVENGLEKAQGLELIGCFPYSVWCWLCEREHVEAGSRSIRWTDEREAHGRCIDG